MKHFRDDYNDQSALYNRIPNDEPVFLLRAQDISAPATVRYYAMQNEKHGGDPEITRLCIDGARRMEEWQRKVKVKRADVNPSKAA